MTGWGRSAAGAKAVRSGWLGGPSLAFRARLVAVVAVLNDPNDESWDHCTVYGVLVFRPDPLSALAVQVQVGSMLVVALAPVDGTPGTVGLVVSMTTLATTE